MRGIAADSPPPSGRIGVLLVNLGTPDEPTPPAVRRYLAEFLSDRRVVEIPRLLWWPILHGVILRTRPAQSARKYQTVWLPEGSPLLVWSRRQAQYLRGALGEQLKQRGLPPATVQVALAMRYGNPGIAPALEQLRSAGCERLLVLPMYPQYSCTTTASVQDALERAGAERLFRQVELVQDWHDNAAYHRAAAASIGAYWQRHGRPDFLLMSFHGVPQFTVDRGDPYQQQCLATAQGIARELGLQEHQWRASFQSRFGRAEWIKPYTADTARSLPAQGVKHLHVVCPGFPADCLETLEEIALEVRDEFLHAGGEQYHYIPALNDNSALIHGLAELVQARIAGWLPVADKVRSS